MMSGPWRGIGRGRGINSQDKTAGYDAWNNEVPPSPSQSRSMYQTVPHQTRSEPSTDCGWEETENWDDSKSANSSGNQVTHNKGGWNTSSSNDNNFGTQQSMGRGRGSQYRTNLNGSSNSSNWRSKNGDPRIGKFGTTGSNNSTVINVSSRNVPRLIGSYDFCFLLFFTHY